MTDTSKSEPSNRHRRWRLFRILPIVALFALVAWWHLEQSRSILPQGQVPTGIDTEKPYFEASFAVPSKSMSGAFTTTTFHIPKAYVDYAGITAWSGGARSVPIVFELPDKTPSSLAPPRPWKNLPHGSPEAEALKKEFSKTNFGTFRLTLGFGVGNAEQFLRLKVKDVDPQSGSQFVQIGSIAGLLRYAKLDCLRPFGPNENEDYRKRRLEEVAKKRAQAEPGDPLVPPNCAIDRRVVTLFTPVSTPAEQALYVDSCDLYSCDSYIRVAGVSARLHIPLELLPRWREIVQPARELAEGFLAVPAPASISSTK